MIPEALVSRMRDRCLSLSWSAVSDLRITATPCLISRKRTIVLRTAQKKSLETADQGVRKACSKRIHAEVAAKKMRGTTRGNAVIFPLSNAASLMNSLPFGTDSFKSPPSSSQ